MRLWVDPALAEEAVFERMRVLEARSHPDAQRWQREREALYAVTSEQRKAPFEALAERWFDRLGLLRPLSTALSSTPCARELVDELRVHRAARRAQEGSELYRDGDRARLVFGLTPLRFAHSEALEEFFLRECLHAEDMLDPAWGYTPRLPSEPGEEPAHAELVRDRLRVLWKARVQGRMARLRGTLPASVAEPEFLRAFGSAGTPSVELDALHALAASGALGDYAALIAAAREPRELHSSV